MLEDRAKVLKIIRQELEADRSRKASVGRGVPGPSLEVRIYDALKAAQEEQ